jgi:hypothetical protein
MADVQPTFRGGVVYGVSIDLADTAIVTGANAGNDVLVRGWIPTGIAVDYDEGGGMTQAIVSLRVKVGGESTVYTVYQNLTAATAYAGPTITATGSYFYPLGGSGAANSGFVIELAGIDSIRAVATVSGTPAEGDVLKVTIVGRRMG